MVQLPGIDAYEDAVRQQASQNEGYLALFEQALRADGDRPGAEVDEALRDARQFLNDYLLYEDDNGLEMGCYLVDDYMEEVVAQGAEPSRTLVERVAHSLVALYRCMHEARLVDEDALDELLATVEAQLPAWKEMCTARGASVPGSSREHLAAMRDVVAQGLGHPRDTRPTREEAIELLTLALLHLREGVDDARTRDALRTLGLSHLVRTA